MEHPISLTYALQQALNALQTGAFYGLLATAYALVYGISRRVNFAFGAVATFSAATTFNLMTLIGASTALGLVPAALFGGVYAVVAAGVLGYVSERLVIAPVIGRANLAMLVTTIALAIALEEAIRIVNGSTEHWLPPLVDHQIVLVPSAIFPVAMSPVQLFGGALALAVSGGLVLFIRRHPFGRLWRAVADDPLAAALMGVDAAEVRSVTFILSSGAAGVAGALMLALYGNVNFHTSLIVALKALLAAIVGGIGSVGWALVGGLVLGVIETGWAAAFGGEWRDVGVFGLLVALFVLRPAGLAPSRGDPDRMP